MNPGFSQILLCPCHRLFDGGHMRGEDPFVAGNESEERSRLRHRECEITAAVAGLGVANLFAVGQFPAQNSFEGRSEEQTSELQSLLRISYAVFCLKNKKSH